MHRRKLVICAKGILVFPEITKGGFMAGGMGGNGALIRNDGPIRDFYQTAGASYRQNGYALFLRTIPPSPAFMCPANPIPETTSPS